ncbi:MULTISPECIES: hypothetical protein [Nocardioides]|uniref:Uncharacterized protein n=1 Tax=Nocardioides vastitatis TaxID=2568655 RepID=A0ABW0ZHB9_9ACTN|nr:hypothetical protein [Nocardioides sp.]THI93484.1 hypothetical protein E7Z54_20850 [Nocardioides sp.]
MRLGDLRAKVSRGAELTEISRVRRQRSWIDQLETAVRENALLARDLEAVIDDMEQAIVPLLERSRRDSDTGKG